MNRCEIIQGDALTVLRTLESESVHCCITSPPYWAQRDYGVDGQLGLEERPEEYLDVMVAVFEEVRRVLRSDGTLWLNMGDGYDAGTRVSRCASEFAGKHGYWTNPLIALRTRATKPKDLIGMPWALAFALRAAGWYLRSDIIWSKPNPMPESVTDRPTKAHEYLFLLAKSERYYYDQEAIREGVGDNTHSRGYGNGGPKRGVDSEEPMVKCWHLPGMVTSRNRRTVWTIPTAPYPDAHFATFPPDLVRPCILAGTSERGVCAACGASWVRVTEKVSFGKAHSDTKFTDTMQGGPLSRSRQAYRASGLEGPLSPQTLGWSPSCSCNAAVQPCTVLDPFLGSGTTLAVALEYGRIGIGIELNPEYIELARKRIEPFELQGILI